MNVPGKTDTPAGRMAVAAVFLLTWALFVTGPSVTVSLAQTDLSVFQKEGVDKAQKSLDRYECHLQALLTAGTPPESSPSAPDPPLPIKERSFRGQKVMKEQEKMEEWKKQTYYNRAVRSCLEDRGYRVIEETGNVPPTETSPP